MNPEGRVLSRRGARELTPQESEHVTGAIQTQTVCSHKGSSMDGDVHIDECGH
jgi:hypothetical protein